MGINTEDLADVRILADLLEEGQRPEGLGPFTDLKPRSTRMPPLSDNNSIDIFSKLRKALEDLSKNKELIFKSSDKGGNIVILDHEEYKKMCNDILSDGTTYGILRGDPTDIFNKKLEAILTEALEFGVISKGEKDFMFQKTPTVPIFYALPKVHKGLSPFKGRPIVSGNDSITQNCGIYIDRVLRQFVTALPSYDTSDLLRKIDRVSLEENILLASIDVEALYSSIPHNKGLQAVEFFLKSRGLHTYAHNNFVRTLLEFVLTNNYFLFNGIYYHQLRGTAMGSPCAPTYTNLLLGWWEETMVFTEDSVAWWCPQIIFWGRYIDDILVFWAGDVSSFGTFVQDLNKNDLGLRFTFETDWQTINFLDINIKKDTEGLLETTLFRKPTATNNLLDWGSSHPHSQRRGIPKGQYLRVKRNCSNPSNFYREAKDLRNRFLDRGYPRNVLQEAFKKVESCDRNSLLTPRETKSDKRTRIIGNFDSCSREVRAIITKYWDILKADSEIKDFLTDTPAITYRRGRSIGDQLVHSMYTPPPRTVPFFFTLHFLSGEKNVRAGALSRSVVSSEEEEEEPRLIVPSESLRTVAPVSLESVPPGKTFVPANLQPEVLSLGSLLQSGIRVSLCPCPCHPKLILGWQTGRWRHVTSGDRTQDAIPGLQGENEGFGGYDIGSLTKQPKLRFIGSKRKNFKTPEDFIEHCWSHNLERTSFHHEAATTTCSSQDFREVERIIRSIVQETELQKLLESA
ncbi:unnamed protein product, partial [Ranitomeya imitator]